MADVTLTVDGRQVRVAAGTLLIEACKSAGIEVLEHDLRLPYEPEQIPRENSRCSCHEKAIVLNGDELGSMAIDWRPSQYLSCEERVQ